MVTKKEIKRMSFDLKLDLYDLIKASSLKNHRTVTQEIRARLTRTFEKEKKIKPQDL